MEVRGPLPAAPRSCRSSSWRWPSLGGGGRPAAAAGSSRSRGRAGAWRGPASPHLTSSVWWHRILVYYDNCLQCASHSSSPHTANSWHCTGRALLFVAAVVTFIINGPSCGSQLKHNPFHMQRLIAFVHLEWKVGHQSKLCCYKPTELLMV